MWENISNTFTTILNTNVFGIFRVSDLIIMVLVMITFWGIFEKMRI